MKYLPSYAYKKLWEICDIVWGGTPQTDIQEYRKNGDILWVTPADLEEPWKITRSIKTKKKISSLGLQHSSAKLLPIWTVLFSSRASIWKVAIAENVLSTNQWFANFICWKGIFNKYLAYCLIRFRRDIEHLSNSTTFKEVSKWSLRDFMIPLPTLSTQKALVTRLDAILITIMSAKSSIQAQINSIDTLWQSSVSNVFRSLPASEAKKLTEMVDIVWWNILPNDSKTYNYVGLENIESSTGNLINFRSTLWKEIKSNKVSFEKWMILYGKLRPYLNKVYVAEFDGIASTEILPMASKDGVDNRFISYYLRSEEFVQAANKSVSWARMPRVTTRFLEEYNQVPYCTISEQQSIVEFLGKFNKNIITLKTLYQQQLAEYDALWQSALDKAFRWELIQ